MLWSFSLAQFAAMPQLPAIAPDIAGMVGGSLADCVPSSFTLLAGLTASISFLWAAWLQVRLRNFQRRAKMDLVAADLAKSFKKALLTGAAEGAVVLKSRGREQQYYGEGKALYDICLESSKTGQVSRAVAALVEAGTPFALSVPCGHCDLI